MDKDINVWVDNSTMAGFEKPLIKYFVDNKRWKNVVYEENNTKLMACGFFESKIKELGSYSIIDADKYNNIYTSIMKFIDMYSRNSLLSQNTYNDMTIHEYINLFNLAINYYYDRFIKEDIDLFIIFRSPHIGIDLVKCVVAKELGIKTLILEQSLIKNRFFYYWDYNDYGSFKTSQVLFPLEKEKIQSGFETNLFYMKKQKRTIIHKIHASLPYFLLKCLLTKKGKICSLYNFHQYLSYVAAKKKINYSFFDKSSKYVYFAMHLQPEKTTSSWGGKYCDQLLALEHLSKLLPDDYIIYVKDNPKQNFFMRGPWFYKRLSLIPKVNIVPNDTNTYDLLRNCVFASTITGTVGWEAIKGGKNVLVFGWGVWYKTLPGVFQYSTNFDLKDILNYKIDHSELEEKYALLKSKMGYGVIYKGYDQMMDSFLASENVKTIASSLEKILDC